MHFIKKKNKKLKDAVIFSSDRSDAAGAARRFHFETKRGAKRRIPLLANVALTAPPQGRINSTPSHPLTGLHAHTER